MPAPSIPERESAAEPASERASDPRWQLLERIVRSPHLVKSSRLRDFLTFVTEETLAGRGDHLNEQRIGIHVFERRVDYDSAEDNIVRSHASRLRQRLEAYFGNEGSEEPLRLELRRGSYVPIFVAVGATSVPRLLPDAVSQPPLMPPVVAEPAGLPEDAPVTHRNRSLTPLLVTIIVLLAGWLGVQQWRLKRFEAAPTSASPTMHRFWSEVFSTGKRNLIVPADSSLVLFENLTGKPITLQQYLSRDYLAGSVNKPSASLEESAKWVAHRRLTSVADVELATSLLRVPEVVSAGPQIRFARDLELVDLKEANLVLIGAEESDPWLSIFQPNLNFVISNDQRSTVFTVGNRSPRTGERAVYQYDPRDPKSNAYALIALRPNLGGDGHVLIVEGTGIAGTEAAAEFLVDKTRIEAVLKPAIGHSGQVPPFEILLETSNLNGSAPRSQVIAVRVGN